MRVYSNAVSTWDDNIQRYVLDESATTYRHYIGLYDACKESEAEKQQRIALQNAQTQAAQSYYQTLPWQQDMAKQQMDLYNKQMTAQIGFQNTYMQQQQDQFKQYMDLMNKSYAGQQKIQGQVSDTMAPYLTKEGQGYTPGQMTALNTQGMSQVAGGYADAEANLRAQLLAHGETGSQPMGGNAIGNIAELQAGLANQTSGMRNTNLLSSYNQALTNKFNAAGAMMGISGQLGQDMGLGASGSSGALGGYGSMASRYASPPVAQMPGAPAMLAPQKPPGFWSGLMSSFAPALGAGAASFGLGGLSNMFSSWMKPNNSGLMSMANAPLW